MCNTCGCKSAEEFGASSNYDFSQIDKILQDMDEDGSIQLTNTDGSQVRRKALRIYENIRTVQEGIKQLREENAETFRIDALENYLLRLKYDLDNELNNWAMVNMNAEAESFEAEPYEGFEQGNHLIEDKYFYELTEREDEYWSRGQNQLNPIWGNDSLIESLITENLNEEGYSPKFVVDFLLETLKQKEKELNIIQRRYKDENIKTFLRRNPITSRRVMNPDFGDNMTGMTPSEGWGSAWINIAIKSLNQEIDDVYERDMNRYGDMPDGAWDYVGELQEVRKQLRRDRNLVFGVPYDAEEFGAESFEATKGMDTYAQPLEELKIKPTKTKVGILLASIVAGGLWYSNKMKE